MTNSQGALFFTTGLSDDQVKTLTSKDKNNVETGIFEVLEGIRGDLGLTQQNFVKVIHVKNSTYSNWKERKKVQFSNPPNLNDLGILKFIDLYDSVTSLYPEKDDYIDWFNSALLISNDEESKTPLQMMEQNPEAVLNLNRYVNWLINP